MSRRELDLIREELGCGSIDRRFVGRGGKRIVNRWKVLDEIELPVVHGDSRYWFGEMEDERGNRAYRILQIDVRGVAHHICIPKDSFLDFLIMLSLDVKQWGSELGLPLSELGPPSPPAHFQPRSKTAYHGDDYQRRPYCPGDQGIWCDGRWWRCGRCGADVGLHRGQGCPLH